MPVELLPESARTGLRMPQLIFPLPSGFSVTVEAEPKAGRGWILTSFMYGGHQADGTPIPGYDFVTEKGITWIGTYINKSPLETRVSKKFYLTREYLYNQIFFGPQPITERLSIAVSNTLDQAVYFATTVFWFELPLEKIMELFAPPIRPLIPRR